MIYSTLKNFSLSLLFGFLLAWFFHLSNAQGDTMKYWILDNPQNNEWIHTAQHFNSLSLEFLDDVAFEDKTAKLSFPGKNNAPNLEVTIYADNEDPEGKFSELFNPGLQNYFQIDTKQKVKVHFYNTEIKDTPLFTAASGTYVGGLKIISRAEWGADESIRYDFRPKDEQRLQEKATLSGAQQRCQDTIDKNPKEYVYDKVVTTESGNELLWPRQYSKQISKIVIHHTAESEKSSNIAGGDKIRSIYYYHAQTKEWGDIGYNYLIDQEGNIYEGRAGGKNVVGGHVYCSNINTIGVSLMGNFMKSQPTAKQLAGLAKLLAALSKEYNIDLSGKTQFHGEKTDALLGHRDLGATACPGDNMYSLLPLLRKHLENADFNFGTVNESITPAQDFSAELSGKPTVIDMQSMQNKTITLAFKNTGKAIWNNNTWLYVNANDNTELWADSIVLSKNYVASKLKEYEVSPGQIGHFEITLNTGLNEGMKTLSFTPILNGERKMNSANTLIAINIQKTILDYEFVKAKNPANPFFYGQNIDATITLKNTGNTTWERSGPFAITLAPLANTLKDGASPFAQTDTANTFAWLQQNQVKPGELGTFEFDIQSGFEQGVFDIPFAPRIGEKNYLKDIGMKFTLKINKPDYQAQILFENSNIEFQPGETRTIRIGLKNISDVDWQENQVSLYVVQNDGLKFQETNFYFPEFVAKNQSSFINLTITAPLKTGKVEAKLQALANNKKFNKTRWLYLPITVKSAELKGEITYLSKQSFQLDPGKEQDITLRVKNTGNINWYNDGENALRLVSLKPNSKMQSKYWIDKNIVALMENKEVVPGKVATFKFTVRKNSTEDIRERFSLKTKSLGTVTEASFEVLIFSEKEPLIQVAPLLEKVDTNDESSIIYEQKDLSQENIVSSVLTDTTTAIQESALSLSLKERIQAKRDALAKEKADRRAKILERFKNLEENKNINSSAVIPGSDPKSSNQTTGGSQKRIVNDWIPDQVRDNKNTISDNNIRILLSFPNTSANILANNANIIIDGKQVATLNTGDSLWTRKDGNRMIVSVNTQKYFGDVIRVESAKPIEIFNWNRSPLWNKNINDNLFEEALEFRISDGEMIVINDLSMAAYLRGMAEVPESEPHEKRKAMAVLARSYAMHYTQTEYKKFPGKSYEGSDSPAVFQKYLGYNYSLRSPKWQEALQETDGEILYYNNEILRTAYFSCSNGTTKSPDQAGWNDTYFTKLAAVYQSVNDKQGKDIDKYNKGLCGHGVGLSGAGAKALAEQGKSYKDILNYYYKNTVLK